MVHKTLLAPNNANNLTTSQLVDFFYSTEKRIYQPFFDLSAERTPQVDIVGKIALSNECENYCDYCSFRKGNPTNRFFITKTQLKNICYIAAHSGIKELIIETGVMNQSRFQQFTKLFNEVISKFPFQVYFDVGSETLLTFPEILTMNNLFFIDYSPVNETFRSTLNSFDKRDNLLKVITSFEGVSFYSNFIVDLPGQSFSDVVNDLITSIKSPIRGIKIAPFMPHKETPFSIFDQGCLLTTLKVICIVRLLKPDIDIFIDSSINDLRHKESMILALEKGANKAILPITLETTDDQINSFLPKIK